MTFLEFKDSLTAETFGDKKVPEDKYLLPLLNKSLEQIARKAKPLTLRTCDISFDLLCWTDEPETFIRKPKEIKNDTDILDIDESLEMAVVYQTAYKFVHMDSKAYYIGLRDGELSTYYWDLYVILNANKELVDD